ncbi:hypothetical protein PHET_08596 [Paragonimus heterotremus]|uniref:V-SNARE coiled-coil homology domain-containing protein n=1 Tax=Paragonimus heterotremus TaxID=100268 RepID=A0A8J4WPB7_9TREM|nr:hypothetical protein PHET_08596 [Paragonimus heterotremus]
MCDLGTANGHPFFSADFWRRGVYFSLCCRYIYFHHLMSATSIPTDGDGEVPRHLPTNKRLQQTQAQVVDIMRTNVEKVLERDQKLSQLDDRADVLQAGASQFEAKHETNDYHRNYRFHHLSCDHRFRYQIIVTLCIRFLVRAVSYRRIFRVVSL